MGWPPLIEDAVGSVALAWIIGIIDRLQQVVQVSGQLRTLWVVPRDREPTCIR